MKKSYKLIETVFPENFKSNPDLGKALEATEYILENIHNTEYSEEENLCQLIIFLSKDDSEMYYLLNRFWSDITLFGEFLDYDKFDLSKIKEGMRLTHMIRSAFPVRK